VRGVAQGQCEGEGVVPTTSADRVVGGVVVIGWAVEVVVSKLVSRLQPVH
jgi:hypothetical protein